MVWLSQVKHSTCVDIRGEFRTAASFLTSIISTVTEVILLNHPLKRLAYEASHNFITTYIKARLCFLCFFFWLEFVWASEAICKLLLMLFHSLLAHLTRSQCRLCFVFFSALSPLFVSLPVFIKLVKFSAAAIASLVLCSAVLITVPFSCLETEYDEGM